jgi:N-acetylneuraminate synthase
MQKQVFISAEIGINHNGDLEIAKKLIKIALEAGCDAVKFQKRTINAVYTDKFLDSFRESPWGKTQREQKEGLEFGKNEYDIIDSYCTEVGIKWFASSWDIEAQVFMRSYDLEYNKIASPMLTNIPLLETVAEEQRYTIISTGMSTWEEIDKAVSIFEKYSCPFELAHCVSVYPMEANEANLLLIPEMKKRYGVPVGYSSHEMDNLTTLGAVALGASSVERHITLDRKMYGSDQSYSVEPEELKNFVFQIKKMESALGTGIRFLSERESLVRKKLRP